MAMEMVTTALAGVATKQLVNALSSVGRNILESQMKKAYAKALTTESAVDDTIIKALCNLMEIDVEGTEPLFTPDEAEE
jgi:Mn-dependent DtxR family transcriptional regulator